LNERFLNVLSTKENVNLETLGFSKEEIAGFQALITPICISNERLGTLFLYRKEEEFCIEDIILSEYSTTVVGLEIMRSEQEKSDNEQHKKSNFSSAVTTLTPLEQKAVCQVFHTLAGEDGTIVTSKLAAGIGITRTVIVNALRKLESAGLIKTKSSGVKGTHIKVLNDIVYTEFDSYYREKWNS
jgi:transcriptional pleiotropic repressor